MLADPLRQPDHRQALAAPLGVPDDAALAPPHMFCRSAHAEVLVVATCLFGAGIEDDKIVDDLEQPLLAADLAERPIERVSDRAIFFPFEVVLLGGFDDTIAQQAVHLTIGVVQGLAGGKDTGLLKLEQHLLDDLVAMPALREPCNQHRLLNMTVADAILPVAEIAVAQLFREALDDMLLGADLALADGAHECVSSCVECTDVSLYDNRQWVGLTLVRRGAQARGSPGEGRLRGLHESAQAPS